MDGSHGFGDNWQARPLIDRQANATMAPHSVQTPPPSPAALAEQEARLAPYESLSTKSKPHWPLCLRLGARAWHDSTPFKTFFCGASLPGRCRCIVDPLANHFPGAGGPCGGFRAGVQQSASFSPASGTSNAAIPLAQEQKSKARKASKRPSLFSDSFSMTMPSPRSFLSGFSFSSSSGSHSVGSNSLSSNASVSNSLLERFRRSFFASPLVGKFNSNNDASSAVRYDRWLARAFPNSFPSARVGGVAMMAGSLAAGYISTKECGTR